MSEQASSGSSQGSGSQQGASQGQEGQGSRGNAGPASNNGSASRGGQQQAVSPSEVKAGNQEGSSQEQPPWLKTKHKVKVGKQELDVDYDELVKGYTTGRDSTRKYEEAARARREAEEFKRKFAEDPFSAAVEAGLMPEDRAYELMMRKVQERLEYEALDPIKRSEIELRQREYAIQQREQQFQQQQQEARINHMAGQYRQEYARAFPEALQRAGVPATEQYMKRMGQFALQATQAGMEWRPEDMARMVREEMMGLRDHAFKEHKSKWEKDDFTEEATVEDFLQTYGEKALKKLIKGHLSKMQKFKNNNPGQPQQTQQSTRQEPNTRPPSFEEYRRRLNRGL